MQIEETRLTNTPILIEHCHSLIPLFPPTNPRSPQSTVSRNASLQFRTELNTSFDSSDFKFEKTTRNRDLSFLTTLTAVACKGTSADLLSCLSAYETSKNESVQTKLKEFTKDFPFSVAEMIKFGRVFKDELFVHSIEKHESRQVDLRVLQKRRFRVYLETDKICQKTFKSQLFPLLCGKFRRKAACFCRFEFSDSEILSVLLSCTSVQSFDLILNDDWLFQFFTLSKNCQKYEYANYKFK